jgi:hypothetical protein
VLNLTVAMIANIGSLFTVLIGICLSPWFQVTQGSFISFPVNGSSIQGIVEIQGTIVSNNFINAEVSYAFSGSTNPNWFVIYQGTQPVQQGVITRWDTTTITDGFYKLKLTVHQKDGSKIERIVDPVYVRNYTLDPTGMPITLINETPIQPTPILKTSQELALTPIPLNPGAIDQKEINSSMISGLIVAGVILAILGIFSLVSRNNRKQ